MRKIILALAAAASLSGCALSGGFGTMDGIMASWKGAHIDQVIQQWGYPHEERVIAGKRLYVWNKTRSFTMPAVSTGQATGTVVGNSVYVSGSSTTTGGGTSLFSCTRIVEVNAQGRVVGTQWDGDNCPFMEAGTYSTWRRK